MKVVLVSNVLHVEHRLAPQTIGIAIYSKIQDSQINQILKRGMATATKRLEKNFPGAWIFEIFYKFVLRWVISTTVIKKIVSQSLEAEFVFAS